MDWSYPTEQMLAQDPAGIEVILERLATEIGEPPIRGTRFLSTASEMLEATRSIESSMVTGDRLAVGFQTFDKFRREIPTYVDLVRRGIIVTAFAQMAGDTDGSGRRARRELFGMRWIELAPHRRHLENQWFLVGSGSTPIVFAGYDISAPARIAAGGITDPHRRFAGFVSDDVRVVDAVAAYLDGVASAGASSDIGEEAVAAARDASVRTIVCSTHESDGEYRRTREAATRLAARVGATLILHDRTAESYLADPYPYPDVVGPDTPIDRLAAFRLGRAYLADQIDEGVAAGVATTAWLPQTPGPKGFAAVAQRTEPDVILVPASLDHPSLIDRIRGNTLDKLRAAVHVPVWTVDAHGRIAPTREARAMT